MADIDWGHFADAFKARLTALGLGRNSAAAAWPATSTAMISRACSGKRLSAGSFLLLCSLAELDSFEFLQMARARRVTRKSIRKAVANQAGTEGVTRETCS